MATYSNVEPSYVLDLFSKDVGYATPKVDVQPAVFQGDKLLFAKERVDGCWSLPGDDADVGDSPSDEIPELSLTRVMPAQIVRIFHYHRHLDLPTYFD